MINPKGPQAELDIKQDFVPVDAVKREVDRGAAVVIIDARPPMDYARMHIAGAISVPFYQTADFAAQLPKDRTIVAYCACPHAESGQVREALRKLGYPRGHRHGRRPCSCGANAAIRCAAVRSPDLTYAAKSSRSALGERTARSHVSRMRFMSSSPSAPVYFLDATDGLRRSLADEVHDPVADRLLGNGGRLCVTSS